MVDDESLEPFFNNTVSDADLANVLKRNLRVSLFDGNNKAVINDLGQLHVVLEGIVDDDNSFDTPINAGIKGEGEWINTLPYAVITVSVKSNVASATNGLMVEFSSDGTNVDGSDEYTIPANAGKTFSFQPQSKYYRVSYTNGGVNQGFFRLQSILKKTYVKPSSHRIQDSIIDDDDAELVKSVLTGQSDIDDIFENVSTYRKALQVDNALVHRVGISEHAKLIAGGSTTLDVEASAGDTLINVTATTDFIVGDQIIVNGTAVHERSHFHITAVDAGVSLTLNRPLDNDHPVGSAVVEVSIAMNVVGSLASPISFKIAPQSNERWQITRIMITMLAAGATAMDDGKFGNLTALTNGVAIRLNIGGQDQTITHWQSNGDLKDDMYDVLYSDKPPAGAFHGLSGRWTFTKAEFVADLDGANGDYLEVLIQDDLSGLADFEIKAQGRLFGG